MESSTPPAHRDRFAVALGQSPRLIRGSATLPLPPTYAQPLVVPQLLHL